MQDFRILCHCPPTAHVPEVIRHRQRINFFPLPPRQFIARRVEVPVMQRAERHREGVRYLAAQGAGLRKLQVVRLGRLPPADQAGVRGDKPQVILVAEALHFRDGEEALVDGPPLRNSSVCGRVSVGRHTRRRRRGWRLSRVAASAVCVHLRGGLTGSIAGSRSRQSRGTPPSVLIAWPRVERQSKGVAEGREGPLGGVGLGRLGGKLMGLPGR